MSKASLQKLIEHDPIEPTILLVRARKVILESDLANIYSVTTKRLNEQIKRNKKRFPEDFMFQLTTREARNLESNRSQIATGSQKHRARLYRPFAFTEHGAIMAASVLKSDRMGDESEAGLGIYFCHLDDCNMEDEFAFSICATLEEWKAEQRRYEERSRKSERERKEASATFMDLDDCELQF